MSYDGQTNLRRRYHNYSGIYQLSPFFHIYCSGVRDFGCSSKKFNAIIEEKGDQTRPLFLNFLPAKEDIKCLKILNCLCAKYSYISGQILRF